MTYIQLAQHHSPKELQTIIKHTRDVTHKNRLCALMAIKKGNTQVQVAQEFGIDRKTIRYWIQQELANMAGKIESFKEVVVVFFIKSIFCRALSISF